MAHADQPPLRILVAADVPPDPNAGASGTVYQMNRALERLGHVVEEVWQPELGRRIRHGNLHYLLELPIAYGGAHLRRRRQPFDVLEFNQPHAYLAAATHRRRKLPGVFVNRSHGHEVRSEEALAPWRRELGVSPPRGVRGWVSSWLRRGLDRQWELISRTADAFHVSSRDDAEYLTSRYGVDPDRIAVVTQGIPEVFVTTPKAPYTAERQRKLLYVGQYAFFKAPMMLARTVTAVLEQRPDVTMTWVCGASHHAEVRALLPESIQSRVTLCDWMPQDDLIRIFDQHGMFLFPSFFEGFGKAPLEAMSRGLCVLATRTGGMRDFIEDGRTGRLVAIGQPQDMAAAALRWLDDLDACRRLSDQARQAAIRHRWDDCANELVGHYRRWLARKQAESSA